jgi:hypothetical protein
MTSWIAGLGLFGLLACGDSKTTMCVVRTGIAHCEGSLDGPPVDTSPPCDLLSQVGCYAGERCTWVQDALNASSGHPGCVPDGVTQTGQACSYTSQTGGYYDDCAKRNACSQGVCELICGVGSPAACITGTCTAHPDLFGSDASLGVCDPA